MAKRVFGLWSLLALLGWCSSALAQRDLKQIPPADPELERQSLQMAEGFEVNLFAADPLIAKPIQMNWDSKGRLWLATSEVYPHIKPGEKANDKILILEDGDGDGVADKTTVFAEGLLIPTGVVPGDGGAYVANSTELLHFADRDGDGKADQKRIVLSGFGTEDTHHILHTFRWGPGGHLYFNQSIYIHSHIETPHGVKRLNGGGIWKFRPETWDLEVFARGWVNPWGHQFDQFGQSFVTDGAGGEGINFLLPGASYVTAVGAQKILPGLNPGSPKYCGLEVVSGRHLPEDWQGNLLTNDFRGHRVCRFVLSDDGAGFAARQEADLIKSTHVAFRPVDVKMGPDGAIYIADWYNPIIQHGEVDFRDPRRDHTHGRIWRVTYKGRPLVPPPKLTEASIPELLEYLKAPEGWTRRHAKRELASRNSEEVADALVGWIAKLDPEDPDYDPHRLEALWTYQTVGLVERNLLVKLMEAKTHEVRAAAVRVAGDWGQQEPALRKMVAERVEDAHPRVRLEAVRALSRMSPRGDDPAAVAEWSMKALEHPMDRWLEHGLWLTCRETAGDWLPRLQSGEFSFSRDPNLRKLAFALDAVGSPEAISLLLKPQYLQKLESLPPKDQLPILQVISRLARPQEMQLVFDAALSADLRGDALVLLFESLAETSRQLRVRPSGHVENGLARMLEQPEIELKIATAELIGLWKVESLREEVTRFAQDKKAAEPLRKTAFEALAHLDGGESRKVLEDLAAGEPSWPLRVEAVESLALLDLPAAAKQVPDLLASLPHEQDPGLVFSIFLERKTGPEALAAALEAKPLPADVAKVGLRLIETTGRPLPKLTGALRTAGQITGDPKPLTPEEKAGLVAEVQSSGNAAAGEMVFRRKDLSCLNCHAIGGAGGRVGPDLLSLGASAQVDYLLDSLLEPSKAIKENYHSLIVATDEGRIVTGVKVRQSDTHLILRDVNDAEVSIPLDSIAAQKDGKSLMPSGLTEKLTRKELVDLVRFLSELGKVGKFSIGQDRVARRWQMLADTEAARHRLRRTSFDTVTREDPAYNWIPAYSKVDGALPVADLPEVGFQAALRGQAGMAFVRTELEVTQGGKVRLVLNEPDHLLIWRGSEPIEPNREIELTLEPGRHRLTFAIDREQRKQDLRLELQDAAGSEAQAQFVMGK